MHKLSSLIILKEGEKMEKKRSLYFFKTPIDVLQEQYNRMLGIDLQEAKRIEKIAEDEGLKLKFNRKIFQKIYNDFLKGGWVSSAVERDEYAKEKGIELKKSERLLQQCYNKQLQEGHLKALAELERYAKKRGVKLRFSS